MPWIEIADLPADFAIVCRRIERVDCVNAADAVLQIGPERLDIIANGRHDAKASDNYSAIVVHLAI
jgi:hypothetical protein